jgi:energy-coupling factor transporter ATP-binding protein EcfA2
MAEKQERIRNEVIAKKRSDMIDKHLKEEMARMKKERVNEKTILLLGQAGAGKTTILKQMRLLYAAEKQDLMRLAWTDVIYLNVIMAIKLLLAVLESIENLEIERSEEALQKKRHLNRITSLNCFPASIKTPLDTVTDTDLPLTTHREPSKLLLARFRLAPFLSIETELRKKLGSFERDDFVPTSPAFCGQDKVKLDGSMSSPVIGFGSVSLRKHQFAADLLLRAGWQEELFHHSTSSLEIDSNSVADSTGSILSSWRRPYSGLQTTLTRRKKDCEDEGDASRSNRFSSVNYKTAKKEDDPSRLLSACLDEIQQLCEGAASEQINARLCGADSAS